MSMPSDDPGSSDLPAEPAGPLLQRALRACALDGELFEEVRDDPAALSQAITVVVGAGFLTALGHFDSLGVLGTVVSVVVATASWYVWAYLAFVLGVALYPPDDPEAPPPALSDMLRTMGFASAPGALRAFGELPWLGGAAAAVATGWVVVAAVMAVQATHRYTQLRRAAGVCLLGWLGHVITLNLLRGWWLGG